MTQTNLANEPTNSENPQIENAASRFAVHIFQTEISEKKIIFQVVKMKDSLLLYINNKDQLQFSDLSLAMKDRFKDSSIGTRLMGDFNEEFSKGIACRLSKKLNKVVFLSCNIDHDRILVPFVEKRIYEEIRNAPEKF